MVGGAIAMFGVSGLMLKDSALNLGVSRLMVGGSSLNLRGRLSQGAEMGFWHRFSRAALVGAVDRLSQKLESKLLTARRLLDLAE